MRYILNPTDFTNWQCLHNLLTTCFAYMDELIDPPSSLHKMTTDSLRKKANEETLLLVFDVENLVAYAFFDIRKDAVYVGKIAVAQSHRGRNIAHEIFDMADNLALKNTKNWLELETRIELIDNHNTFCKMGFTITSKNSHIGYDRPTSITMRRRVKS